MSDYSFVTQETWDRNPCLNAECPFPKYQGVKWATVVEQDPDYVNWLLHESDARLSGKMVMALEEALVDVLP
jgi:hypothetical protein